MWLGVVFVAAVGAPIPMYEYAGCDLITDAGQGHCTELITVAVRSYDPTAADDETAALCCDVATVHTPSADDDGSNLDNVPTAELTADELLEYCYSVITYAPANAAWCRTRDGWWF